MATLVVALPSMAIVSGQQGAETSTGRVSETAAFPAEKMTFVHIKALVADKDIPVQDDEIVSLPEMQDDAQER
ncbi:MAG: hypothetical protein AAGF15_00970 [Pseudomonadota bacterium]